MVMTAKEIAQQLTDDDWSMQYTVTNPGGYDVPSEFSVMVKRKGQSLTTTYSKGAGLRVWKQPRHASEYWTPKAGQRVPMTPKLKRGVERNEDLIKEYNAITEAEQPTIDEVVWSLTSDANCVRHGQTFDDFCSELGYDTDSRKAEGIFNACRDIWAGLVRLGADIDGLDLLFTDY